MPKVNCNQLISEKERDSYQMPPVDFLAVCFVLAMVLMGTCGLAAPIYLSPDGQASGPNLRGISDLDAHIWP
jgi:hypothetical protein